VFVIMPPPTLKPSKTKQQQHQHQHQLEQPDFGFGLAEGPAAIALPSAGTRSAAANYRIAAGTDIAAVGFGYMEVMLRNGNNHESTVTAISFCDELQVREVQVQVQVQVKEVWLIIYTNPPPPSNHCTPPAVCICRHEPNSQDMDL
jgi:hypothetical protein